MNKGGYNLILIGVKKVGFMALKSLLQADARIVAVLTAEAEENHELIDLARQNNIEVAFEENISLFKKRNAQRGLMFSYPKRLSQSMINIFSHGIYNFHPAKLPEYRGCLPTVWPILYGDREAVCSVHTVVHDFDAGGIVLQHSLPIHDSDTGYSLYDRVIEAEIALLKDHMNEFIYGSFVPKPQDETKARYFNNRIPNKGEINWKESAVNIERFIRAVYHPKFKAAWTSVNGHGVEILEAQIASIKGSVSSPGKVLNQDSNLVFSCSDGFIRAKKVRIGGKYFNGNVIEYLNQNGAVSAHQ